MNNLALHLNSSIKGPLLFSLICLLLSACGPSAEDLAATQLAAITQTQAALPTATPAPSATPTYTPTTVLTDTPAPSATPTDAPTPEPKVVVSASGETPAYSGPGSDPYVVVTTLSQGQELDYVGRSTDGQWIAIALTDYQDVWVSVEHLLINFDIDTLEEIAAPATPETKYKLVIVNNSWNDVFVSIPDAGIAATLLKQDQMLVYTLSPQTYTVYIGRDKSGGKATVVVLSGNKTMTLTSRDEYRTYITVE